MTVVLTAFAAFALVMAAMAIGVIFSHRAIKGSCGGLGALAAKVGVPLCECGGDRTRCVSLEAPPPADASVGQTTETDQVRTPA
ncbi:MAG: (Na+)-NQR maturation NqrM [Candidatus Latescibacterota bacterium]|jgi:hypothetical protein